MSKSKNIIRVGDQVRIVNPNLFIQCDYEHNFNSIHSQVSQKLTGDVKNFLYSVKLFENEMPLFSELDYHLDYHLHEKACKEIINTLTHAKLKTLSKTGNKRTITTYLNESFRDKVVCVSEVFYVKTGVYEQAHTFGLDDYEPACLNNIKTHKILKCNEDGYSHFKIEAMNVIKIGVDE